MDMTILAQNRISITTLDNSYNSAAVVHAYEGNARQSQMMHYQISKPKEEVDDLWVNIVKRNIENHVVNPGFARGRGAYVAQQRHPC